MASGWRAADGSSCGRRAGPVKPKATAVAMHALDHARRPPTTTCASKRASCQMPMTEGGGRWRDSASRWSAGPTPAARPDAMPAMSEPGGRRKSRRRAGSRRSRCRMPSNNARVHANLSAQEPLRDFGEGINGPMGRPHVPLDVCRGYTSRSKTCRTSLPRVSFTAVRSVLLDTEAAPCRSLLALSRRRLSYRPRLRAGAAASRPRRPGTRRRAERSSQYTLLRR